MPIVPYDLNYSTKMERVINLAPLGRLKTFRYTAILATGICLAGGDFSDPVGAAPLRSKQIHVEYTLPKNPAHQPIYERMKQQRGLERIQELLSPFRLPRPLLLKLAGCDGDSNAWYEDGVVTVCYEFLADVVKNEPDRPLPSGVTQEDTRAASGRVFA